MHITAGPMRHAGPDRPLATARQPAYEEEDPLSHSAAAHCGAEEQLAALPYRISDELWDGVAPLIPAPPSHTRGGRPRLDNRRAFTAMVYVLRGGRRWKDLPPSLGAPSTVHDRYQEWLAAGLFASLSQIGLGEHPDLCGIDWDHLRRH